LQQNLSKKILLQQIVTTNFQKGNAIKMAKQQFCIDWLQQNSQVLTTPILVCTK
jgi:hypothetical protein